MTLRVLHVITRLEPGGAQRNTLYTVSHLDRSRFCPALAWGPGDRLDHFARQINEISRFEIPDLVREIAPHKDIKALTALRSAIEHFDPHIVHTHSSKAGILGRLAARLATRPLTVHSIHGFGFTPIQPAIVRALFFAAEKIAARWTDHFIAVSQPNLELGVILGLFAPHQVSLIRSGIKLDRFRAPDKEGARIRRELDIAIDAPLIVQIGNFKPQKAPLDFVRAASLVHAHFPETHFLMVGDGVLRNQAEHMSQELGLGEHLTFCGWRDDIPALLDAATLSVLTSRHEGLPRAIVESLAAGVPVVATRVDGSAEIVRHGYNGFLANAGNIAEIAGHVCTMLSDPQLLHRLAEQAAQDLDEFDIDTMVRQQEELYECLIGHTSS